MRKLIVVLMVLTLVFVLSIHSALADPGGNANNRIPAVPTSGSATLFVAANDAPAVVKARADYLCDGMADNVQINAALTAGKVVQLSEGTFNLALGVVIGSNQSIIGSGRETILQPSATLGDYNYCIQNLLQTTSNILIKDIQFGRGIDNFQECKGIELHLVTFGRIEGCYFNHTFGQALCLVDCQGQGVVIENNIFIGCGFPGGFETMYFDQCNGMVLGNTISESASTGIEGCISIISNNYIEKSGGCGMDIDGLYTNVTGNVVRQSSQNYDGWYPDIRVTGTSNNIQSNICDAGSLPNRPSYGIEIYSGAFDNRVINNLLSIGYRIAPYRDAGTGTIYVGWQ